MAFLRTFGLIALTVVFVLLSLFVYTKLAGPIPFSVNSITTQKSDSFSVTGEGKASIKPDKATLRLGVIADGSTADIAKNKMNEVINQVTAELKSLGIAEKDIKTENLNVYENYDNRPLPAEKAGTATPAVQDPNSRAVSYRANTTLVVTVSQIDLANQVIDVGTKNGINQIGGVEFDNADKTKAENEARIKAVANAKAKAETAAQAAGFTLGKIINYQEGMGGGGPVMYGKTMDAAVPAASKTELNPGENEVVINVTLSYEVR